jgi:hypothetical protein
MLADSLSLGQLLFELRKTQIKNCVSFGFFSKPMEITLQILNKSIRKPPGAQPHMLTNLSVNIMMICQKPVGLRATQVENSKIY